MHRAAKTKRSREDCSRPLLGVHCNEPSCATSRCLKLPELARWDGATECVQLQRLRHALPISIGMRHIFPARATRRSCPTPELANAGNMWRMQVEMGKDWQRRSCTHSRSIPETCTAISVSLIPHKIARRKLHLHHPAGAEVISNAHG